MTQGNPGNPEQRRGTNTPPERYYPHEGYIQLWRRFRSHRFWYAKENRAATKEEAWIDILFEVAHSHRERYWHGVHVVEEPGEWVTSGPELATRFRWSRKKTREFLAGLEKGGEVTLRPYRWGTRMTVLGRATVKPSTLTPPEKGARVGARVGANRRANQRANLTPDTAASCPGEGPTEGPTKGPDLGPDLGPTSKEVRSKNLKTTPPHHPPSGRVAQHLNSTPDADGYEKILTKAAANIVGAHQKATGDPRPPSVLEMDRARRAVKAYDGDPQDIADFVTATIQAAPKDAQGRPLDKSGEPIKSVAYTLAAWERRDAPKASREPERREPEPESGQRAYHAPAKLVKPRELTDAESESAVRHIGGILGNLQTLTPSKGGK